MKAAALLAGLVLAGPLFSLPCARAQTFTADFGQWSGPPLVKTKFGVYQTPFLSPAVWAKMGPLLREAGVRDLRYEMAWGKPDAQAYNQISGTAALPTINFGPLDSIGDTLSAAGVHPLFALTYDPLPLQTGAGWQRWKDAPGDLDAFGRINRAYAAHDRRRLDAGAPFYEVWNEPDLPGDGGKVFFNGGPADYARVYAAALAGLRAGDADAPVGGPGIAYDTSYVAAALAHPMDFVSIHAYANYAAQVRAVRPLIASRPRLPIFLTEYASYSSFGLHAPVSRAGAAAAFFDDVDGLLTLTDVPKVYWAQWADDSLGMLTSGLRRKALFNALKIYQTLLPVDRSPVRAENPGVVGALASSDDHVAAVVLWNRGGVPASLAVRLVHLPFASGTLAVTRIDNGHASFLDAPLSENLIVEARQAVTTRAAAWAGTLPAHGVVLLRVTDNTAGHQAAPPPIGRFVRLSHWFPDRTSDSYADYDPQTGTARLGSGRNGAVAQVGVILDRPAARLSVQVKRQGTFAGRGSNSLFGVRVAYETARGWTRGLLWRDGRDRARAVPALVWGRGAFVMDIARNAPPGWDGRILLTPILQNEGADTQARLSFRPASGTAF